ncbi:MAG TPA: HlyD family efflux transporter periplasmic adaptor subunit, partial [Micromonosporaceae bacterium]
MRRAPLAALILLAVALSLTAAACEPSDDGIATDTVRIGTVTEVVDVPASVTAKAVATLTAAADGTIAALRVAPGTPVKKGAVLAVIDSPTARKRLADAKAALAAAGRVGGSGYVSLGGLQQNLDSAANDAFAAARTAANQVSDEQIRAALLAQVTASQQRYESVAKHSRQLVRQVQQGIAGIGEAVQALGEAQRVQARAAYDLAKATVDALTMRAPIAGVVQFARPATASGGDALSGLLGSLGAGAAGAAGAAGSGGGDQNVAGVDDVLSVGDRVSAGTPILSIVDISEIGLAGEVDETDVLLVSPGVAADVELDAAPGFSYHATVQSV